jgi:hypothetical protein
MRHLITNLLVVTKWNLTCLSEIKQQHDKDMKHYVSCKMRHLISNLVVPELNLTCLREMKLQLNEKLEQSTIHLTTCCLTHPSSWQLRFPYPHHIFYVFWGHRVINSFLEITSRWFWWWWEKLSMNTLQENITVNYDIINNTQRKCRTKTTFLSFSLSRPQWNGHVGRGQDQYLLPHVSYSKLTWDWQSKLHLHKSLSVSTEGFSSWFELFCGRPLLFSLSFCLIHWGDQGTGSLLPIVCGLWVWMHLSSLPHDLLL